MPEIIRREGCVFCKIVAKEEPATIRYEDDEVIVFDNKLTWAPIMLLAVPKSHTLQEDLWSSELIGKVGKVACDIGDEMCSQRVQAHFQRGPGRHAEPVPRPRPYPRRDAPWPLCLGPRFLA